jgi:hypothetical protein
MPLKLTRRLKPVALAACCVTIGTLSSCGGARPSEPATSASIALRAGTPQATLPGLTLLLTAVVNDSRCPEDVSCAVAGDADVNLSVPGDSLSLPPFITLHTTSEPRAANLHEFEVRLDSLTPRPNTQRTIEQSEYRAFVTVKRR